MRALVAELGRTDNLPSGLGPLLEAVPREHFIPTRGWVKRVPIDRRADPETWRSAVYSDVSIVVQYDDGRTEWPEAGDYPTCSASQPSVVLGMLNELDVQPGMSVLEIGTGTGYNAALLAELVGAGGKVTTMEIDAQLAEWAETALLDFDCVNTTVLAQDGGLGSSDDGPFDRVIATAAVHLGHVPYAWVEQTRPGGIILAPVRGDLAAGPLVRFTVHDDGTATGETLPMGVAFMESRTRRSPDVPDELPEWDTQGAKISEYSTAVAPWPLLDEPSARWALAVAMPGCRAGIRKREHGDEAWFRDPVTHSWASVCATADGRYHVRQAGIRKLWSEALAARRWWHSQGRPSITDWKWTITRESQSITLR
ncbi:protein-L-isoaspartate(D-aspartate) O-methyltransferase [Amycolatopsis sp. A1MSW2902]